MRLKIVTKNSSPTSARTKSTGDLSITGSRTIIFRKHIVEKFKDYQYVEFATDEDEPQSLYLLFNNNSGSKIRVSKQLGTNSFSLLYKIHAASYMNEIGIKREMKSRRYILKETEIDGETYYKVVEHDK